MDHDDQPSPTMELPGPEAPAAPDAAGPAVSASGSARRRQSRTRRLFMRPRRVLVFSHRWISLVLTAWLIVIGLTGAYLAEQHGIDAKLHSERYTHGDRDLGAQAAVSAVEEQMTADSEVTYVVVPKYGRGVYQVSVSEPAPDLPPIDEETPATREWTYFVDPATAEVNSRIQYDDQFSWWVYRGHMYLWQDHGLFGADDPNGGWCVPDPDGIKGAACAILPNGEQMVGWFGVAWFIILVTGLYIWFWPGVRRWATALRVRRGRGLFTFNLDLHRSLGFVFVIPLLIVTFTGVGFVFENVKSWYQNVTPAQQDFELWAGGEEAVSTPVEGAEPLDLTGAVGAAKAAFPDRAMASIVGFPADETGTWQFWMDYGYSPWTRESSGGNALVIVDQYSGDVLYDGTPEEGNIADQAWDDWSFPLHAGDVGGPVTRAIWVFVGVAPLALALTGVWMFFLRRGKRKKAAKRRAAREDTIDLNAAEASITDSAEPDVDPTVPTLA